VTSDSCSLEVIPFPSSIVPDSRDHAKAEAMLRFELHVAGMLINLPAWRNNARLRKPKNS
jgi:hypothetical protein